MLHAHRINAMRWHRSMVRRSDGSKKRRLLDAIILDASRHTDRSRPHQHPTLVRRESGDPSPGRRTAAPRQVFGSLEWLSRGAAKRVRGSRAPAHRAVAPPAHPNCGRICQAAERSAFQVKLDSLRQRRAQPAEPCETMLTTYPQQQQAGKSRARDRTQWRISTRQPALPTWLAWMRSRLRDRMLELALK